MLANISRYNQWYMLPALCGKFSTSGRYNSIISRNDTRYVTDMLWHITNISRNGSFPGITPVVYLYQICSCGPFWLEIKVSLMQWIKVPLCHMCTHIPLSLVFDLSMCQGRAWCIKLDFLCVFLRMDQSDCKIVKYYIQHTTGKFCLTIQVV